MLSIKEDTIESRWKYPFVSKSFWKFSKYFVSLCIFRNFLFFSLYESETWCEKFLTKICVLFLVLSGRLLGVCQKFWYTDVGFVLSFVQCEYLRSLSVQVRNTQETSFNFLRKKLFLFTHKEHFRYVEMDGSNNFLIFHDFLHFCRENFKFRTVSVTKT